MTEEQKLKESIRKKKYYASLSKERKSKILIRQQQLSYKKQKASSYKKRYKEDQIFRKKQNQAIVKSSRKRYKTDINFRLSDILRSRLNKAISNNQKSGSAVSDLGCSVAKLKIYLQMKFHRNSRGRHECMTWDNYGHKTWHIDHIKPLSSFNLTDPKQLKEACHYTNLQPLWARDNIKKSNKYNP
jgi:hypothetical protein